MSAETPLWKAEFTLSLDDARRLIEARFPELAPANCQRLGEGWDNLAVLVNNGLVFRFPRRAIAADLIRIESAVLPQISKQLPLPIPCPRWISEPCAAFPYPFAGYPLLPGEPACRRPPSDDRRADSAPALAAFLSALHAIAPPNPCPKDLLQRADRRQRLPVLLERLRACGPSNEGHIRRLAEDLAEGEPAPEDRLVHGDLYACHLLVNADDSPCGIIDWGDLHRGDPALDLSLAWAYLPKKALPAFVEAYGGLDLACRRRARFRALYSGVMLMHYGQSIGDHDFVQIGNRAISGSFHE